MFEASNDSKAPASAGASAPDRVFEREAQWYFRTRGDNPEGPYGSRAEAEQALARFVRRRSSELDFSLKGLRTLLRGGDPSSDRAA